MNSDDPSTWTVTFDGIGPLTLGAALSAPVTAVLTESPQPTLCRAFDADGIDSILVAPEAGADSIGVLYLSGPESRGRPATDEGIGLGSSAQEVLAAYPDALLTSDEFGQHYTITDGAGRYIHFGLGDGTVADMHVLESAEVPLELCG